MKFYGYQENGNDSLLTLEEVSMAVTCVDEIRYLIDFLNYVANEMERRDEFGHEHFSDFINKQKTGLSVKRPDFIVARI